MAIVIDIGAQADLAVFTQLASALKGVQGGLSGVTSQARQATQAAAGGGGFMQAIVGTRPPVQGPTPLQQFQFLNAANRVTGGQFRQQAGQAAATGWNFYSQRFQQTGDPRALAAMNQLSGHLARQNQAGALSTFIRSTRFNIWANNGCRKRARASVCIAGGPDRDCDNGVYSGCGIGDVGQGPAPGVYVGDA